MPAAIMILRFRLAGFIPDRDTVRPIVGEGRKDPRIPWDDGGLFMPWPHMGPEGHADTVISPMP